MGIKSELHEAILKRGGKVPPYGGIAAAMDELNKLPGGGGDCDWNTMKNRPFGTEYGTIEVLGETTVAPEEGIFAIPFNGAVEEGKQYKVIWNGTEYEVTAQRLDDVAVMLGNSSAFGGSDTGEPFAMACVNQDGMWGAEGTALDGSTSVTLSIRTEGEIVTQIDPKYIPGGAGGGDIVNLYIKPGYTEYMWKNADDVGDNSKALTYNEAVDAAEKTVRITSYYGGAAVYATCHSICVNKTEGFVEFNHFDGGKYKVSMA